MPRVTAILPLHNHRDYVAAAVRSLASQTYRDMHIVIADDGSRDGSVNASIEAIAPFSSAVTFLFASRGGPAAARNRALAQTDSEFVAFMDADDLCRPDRIALQMEAMTAGALDLVASPLSFIDTAGRALPGTWAPPVHASRDYWGALVDRNWIGTPSVLARRSILERVGYFDIAFTHAEDYDLWLRAGRGHRIGCLSAPLIQCRRHAENTSNNLDAHRRFETLALSRIDPVEVRAALERLHPSAVDCEEAWIWFLLRSCSPDLSAALACAIETFPQSYSLRFARGIAWSDAGRMEEAAAVFRSLAPDPAALNNAAVCEVVSGNPTGAAREFNAALHAHPSYHDARYNLATLDCGKPLRLTRRPFRESLVPIPA